MDIKETILVKNEPEESIPTECNEVESVHCPVKQEQSEEPLANGNEEESYFIVEYKEEPEISIDNEEETEQITPEADNVQAFVPIVINSQNIIFNCPQCNMEFDQHSDFINHIYVEHKLNTLDNLNLKRLAKREKYNDEIYQCMVCNEIITITSSQSVLDHPFKHLLHMPYKCRLCGECYQNSTQIATHLTACKLKSWDYDEFIIYLCPVCKCQLKSMISWQNHLLRQHDDFFGEANLNMQYDFTNDKVQCCDCKVELPRNQEIMKKHKLLHILGKCFVCEICKEEATTQKSIITHINCQHEHDIELLAKDCHAMDKYIEYACVHCNEEFEKSSTWQQHMRAEHQFSLDHTNMKRLLNGTFKCSLCEAEIMNYLAMRRHIFEHMSHKAYKCKICHIRFYTETPLQMHIKKYHQNSNEFKNATSTTAASTFEAYQSNKNINTCSEDTQAVVNITDSEEPASTTKNAIQNQEISKYITYACPECDKRMNSHDEWKKHTSTKHDFLAKVHKNTKSLPNGRLKCTECNSDVRNLAGMKQHKLLHMQHKSFICKICQLRASFKHITMQHLRVRHFGYTKANDLNTAQTTVDFDPHDYITFACPQCNRLMGSFKEWKAHTSKKHDIFAKWNLNIKNLSNGRLLCTKCGADFVDLASIRQHKLIHLPYQSFICNLCLVRAKFKHLIVNHLRKKHFQTEQQLLEQQKQIIPLGNDDDNDDDVECEELEGDDLNDVRIFIAQKKAQNTQKSENQVSKQIIDIKAPENEAQESSSSSSAYLVPQNEPTNDSVELFKVDDNCYDGDIPAPLNSSVSMMMDFYQSDCKKEAEAPSSTSKKSAEDGTVVDNSSEIFDLDEHILYACPECNQNINNFNEWEQHINTQHACFTETNLNIKYLSSALFQCRICEVVINNLNDMKQHKLEHMPYPSFICVYCNSRRRQKKQLVRHLQLYHLYQHYEVNSVDNKGYNLQDFKSYVSYACPECNESCNSYKSWSVHINTAHTCFEKQQLNFEKLSNNKFQCKECKATITAGKRRHKLLHLPYKSFICKRCNKSYKHKRILMQHIRDYHLASEPERKELPEIDDISYACPECNAEIGTYEDWKAHTNTQHTFFDEKYLKMRRLDNQRFECTECSANFHSLCGIRRHILIHMPYDSFICKICQERTRYRHLILVHLRKKHGETQNETQNEPEQSDEVAASVDNILKIMTVNSDDSSDVSMDSYIDSSEEGQVEDEFQLEEEEELLVNDGSSNSNAIITNADGDDWYENIAFNCPVCNEGMITQNDWLTHIGENHDFLNDTEFTSQNLISNKWQCSVCDMETEVLNVIKEHIYVHLPYSSYTCKICEHHARLESEIRKHLNEHDSKARQFKCPICFVVFKTANDFVVHVKEIHDSNDTNK